MQANELREEMQKEGSPYLLLDVREMDEIIEEPFASGERADILPLPLTALMVLPKDELLARFTDSARRMEKPLSDIRIVTACRSGNRSRFAAAHLVSLGIRAESAEGGRIAWGGML